VFSLSPGVCSSSRVCLTRLQGKLIGMVKISPGVETWAFSTYEDGGHERAAARGSATELLGNCESVIQSHAIQWEPLGTM